MYNLHNSNSMVLVTYTPFKITVLIFQGALYFGVERLLLKCKVWFSEVSSSKDSGSSQIQLDDLIHIWRFGLECGEDLCDVYTVRDDEICKIMLVMVQFLKLTFTVSTLIDRF
jgi:hypothetical protein